MPQLAALTISITVLAFIDTYLTATILPIPVWVTFVGWASFFACGGGTGGLVKSIISNWIGVVIASCSLLVIAATPGSAFVAALAVGIGSGVMIVASGIPFLRYPPAIVFGFASLVSTVFGTGHGVTEIGPNHPTLIAALAMLVGAGFGLASEWLANALTAKPQVANRTT